MSRLPWVPTVAIAAFMMALGPTGGRAALPPEAVGPPEIEIPRGADARLVLTGGHTRLACTESVGMELECEIEGAYRFRNEGNEPVEVRFWPTQPSGETTHELDGATLQELRVRIEPGEHTFRTSGRVSLHAGAGWFIPALRARHMVLGHHPRTSTRLVLQHHRGEQHRGHGGWASRAVTELELSAPPDWTVTRDREHGGDADVEYLYIEKAQGLRFFHGGPLLGITSIVGGNERARFGYEVGFREWVIAALEVDTDFRNVVIIAPRIEVATPQLFLLPSLGAALGVPARMDDGTRVGARLQLTVSILIARFVTTFDYFPSGDLWEVGLGGAVGL